MKLTRQIFDQLEYGNKHIESDAYVCYFFNNHSDLDDYIVFADPMDYLNTKIDYVDLEEYEHTVFCDDNICIIRFPF